MRKKFLVFALAAVVGVSAVPATNISAKSVIPKDKKEIAYGAEDEDDFYEDDFYDEEEEDEDPDVAGRLTRGDIEVSPAKKTIKVKKSFYISVTPSDEIADEWEDASDEEWDELCDESIDAITYRSTRSSVASVNKKGKVKGKKKGSAIIKTTVTFSDGSEGTYKTKVYVKR